MNSDQVGGLVRSVLAFVGAWLISHNDVTAANWATISTWLMAGISALPLLVSVGWTLWANRVKRSTILATLPPPGVTPLAPTPAVVSAAK